MSGVGAPTGAEGAATLALLLLVGLNSFSIVTNTCSTMTCPMAESGGIEHCISTAISKCPFLHSLSQQQGVEFARQVALRPTVPANPHAKLPVLEEHYSAFAISVQQVHGPHGAVPLARFCTSEIKSPDVAQRALSPVASISLGFGGLVRTKVCSVFHLHTFTARSI